MRLVDDLLSEAGAWDEWLARARVGIDSSARDTHTKERAKAVADELSKLPRARRRTILDVGCGDGFDSVSFSAFGAVTATDLAPRTIEDASRRYAGSGVKFVAGDFLALELPAAPFDVVVTLETLSHVHDQSGFIRRCAELLVPDGTLVITTQNKAVYDFLGHGPPNGYHRRWLASAELRSLMAPFFEVQSIRTISPAPPGRLKPALDGRRPPLPLRIAYSHKLNSLLKSFVAPTPIDRLKERIGMARTLVAVGRKRRQM